MIQSWRKRARGDRGGRRVRREETEEAGSEERGDRGGGETRGREGELGRKKRQTKSAGEREDRKGATHREYTYECFYNRNKETVTKANKQRANYWKKISANLCSFSFISLLSPIISLLLLLFLPSLFFSHSTHTYKWQAAKEPSVQASRENREISLSTQVFV